MKPPRRVRSFVLRAGRITVGQERALATLWPTYGLDMTGNCLGLDAVFGRSAPRCVEIGFGTGEVIGALAQANPHIDYLGIEVHRPGVGRLLLHANSAGVTNLRVICDDAVEVFQSALPDESVDEVLVFFPDPWHKKRHHKRRLVTSSFVELMVRKLRPAGMLRLATDWESYADQMLEVCGSHPLLVPTDPGGFAPRPEFRPITRFERRGERLGHGVWDLAYSKSIVATRNIYILR